MFKNIKSNREGFTIVETLIVLAIAAVIIIIVLLAVPALQRTARNNDIKTDASTVAAEVNEFESDNNGTIPSIITNLNGGASATATSAKTGTLSVGTSAANLITTSVSSSDTIWYVAYATGETTPPYPTTGAAVGTNVTPGWILAVIGAQCPSGGISGSTTGTEAALSSNGSAVAVFYPIEGGATASNVGCVQG